MELRKKGAARVLITDGSRIAADSSRDATILAMSPAVKIAHISGAGDSFAAAHVAAEGQGCEPRSRTEIGVAGGIQPCLRRGIDMILPAYSDEVFNARNSGAPIVALESTVITHGLPFPSKLETARQTESDVREPGAVPATVAIIDGQIRIGLSDIELQMLSRSADTAKLSRADIPMAIAQGRTRPTTAAATMICADRAGSDVFATGGIGGVHRGAESSLDVSADLRELALTPSRSWRQARRQSSTCRRPSRFWKPSESR